MKYLNFTKYLAIVAMAGFVFSSCDKVESPEPMGDAGQTLVKILGGDNPATVKLWSIDFVNAPSTLMAVDVRRDIPNPAELQKTMTVVVKDDTAMIAFYNRDTVSSNPDRLNPNKETIVKLPAAFYTVGNATPKVGGEGGTFTLTFKPGEFAKEIYITIPNATLLSTSATYGLAFTIISADADGKISNQRTVLYKIGAKNAYDGIYEDQFTNYHPTLNPGYTGDVTEVHMITTGATTVKMFWPLAGTFANPAILSGAFSYFGLQEPSYTVNPATNIVTVQNTAAGAVTFYTMSTLQVNKYDAATKTFDVRWGYSYAVPGVFDPACREWTQKLKYLRSR